jgi:gamma-glutamyltranspeptidase/glutathione hydrolase
MCVPFLAAWRQPSRQDYGDIIERMTAPAAPFLGADPFTSRPTLTGDFGMSASTHWLATASAQSVLERGGNAFDAVVAGGFVLHVVEPHLNGAGGDLVGLFSRGDDERPTVLMGQGPAPAGASIEHFRSLRLELVPGSGALAAAIPGAVDAWLLLLRDHGTWEVGPILQYAIDLARRGHTLSAPARSTIAAVRQLFTEHWPTSAEQWLVDGQAPTAGDVFTLPRYADTLERLALAAVGSDREARIDAVRAEWRSGFVAEAITAAMPVAHRHSSGGDFAGVLTAADLSSFSAGYETPLAYDFRGTTVMKAGAWSQGPVLLATLAILAGYDDAQLDPSTAGGAHRIIEALKLALADRDSYFGDYPGADDVVATLVSQPYADLRRGEIGERASRNFRPGRPDGREPYLPPMRLDAEAARPGDTGEPTVGSDGATRGDTCHIDIVDRWGNVVSVTPSGGWLQSSPTIPGLGFCLGTRLQMTWLDARSPAALLPGRRPRTTLSPTLLRRGGKTIAALGTPGGDQQDQWQLLYLLRRIVGGHSPQQAIDAPAFHTTAMPGSFWPRTWTPAGVVVESRLGDELSAELAARGHVVSSVGPWSLGRLSTVERDAETGRLHAAANPRGAQGYAAGR